ncbi:unnamed protein product [Adineta steineri]|uniref:LisH domain-containing protein n=1 Tax=Adineta steineri TaxID=433720 RepID=A0A814CK32_9BILA|nr:unnamed protein product [Adineta steineri]
MSVDSLNGDDPIDQRNDNDVELRELVYQSLERDGLITRLKAQLRAAVFKTIEKASNPSDVIQKPGYEGTTGRICRALVLDWLEQSRLLYTQDIFKVETSGPNHPPPLTHNELLEQLHLDTIQNKSQPILHALLNQSNHHQSDKIVSLPDHIKQSIDMKFPNEKINDTNRLREHFRSLFSSVFDVSVLDAFLNKNILLSTTTIPKMDYEQICLKWIQSCSKALTPQSSSTKQTSPIIPIQPLTTRSIVTNGQPTTRARRSTSPPSESNSSSISTSSSENPRKNAYDFPLPTTIDSNKSVIKKSTDVLPPPLLNFNNNSTNEDDDDDTTSSLFSRRNATPAALNHLKNIEDIIHDNETPRTKTAVQKVSSINGNKDIPIEYDDESMSQSQLSSIDDVTVDKASPSPSAHIDFLEDL